MFRIPNFLLRKNLESLKNFDKESEIIISASKKIHFDNSVKEELQKSRMML